MFPRLKISRYTREFYLSFLFHVEAKREFCWKSATCQKQSWVRNGSFTQMLTSKNQRENFSSESHYTRFQRPDDNKKIQAKITFLY